MQRFNAFLAVGAMLFALVVAPFVHVHDRDHHDDHAFVHAHFLESEHPTHQDEYEFEGEHSHDQAKWVNVFALSAPIITSYQATAEFSQPLSLPAPKVIRTAIAVETVRAHSPPEASDLIPRSPPVL